MRFIAITAALAALAAPATAATYSDIGEFATFTIGGNFHDGSTGPTVLGETLFNFTNPAGVVAGTEEFEGLNGMVPGGLAPLTLTIGTGMVNNGHSFSVDYDRGTGMTAISDPADTNPAPGGEMGTLTFTISDTLQAQILTASTLQIITLSGLLDVTDGAGFYQADAGSWVFSATIGTSSDSGTYSLSVSVPPVSEPAVLAVVGAGVLALGLARRRA